MWSSLLQNGTSACPGSLYIDFIGHIILDERETSLGTAALYTNCWLGNCWRTWVAMNCWLGMWPCYKRHMSMPPYFVSIECHKRRKTQYLGTFTLKYLYISKKNFLTLFKEAFLRVFELGWKFGVNLLETHFIADPVLIVFVHFQAWGPICTKARPL